MNIPRYSLRGAVHFLGAADRKNSRRISLPHLRLRPARVAHPAPTPLPRVRHRDKQRFDPLTNPLVHRRYRGRIKSYVQTFWLVLFHPGKLARATAIREGQEGRRAARRFYWITLFASFNHWNTSILMIAIRQGQEALFRFGHEFQDGIVFWIGFGHDFPVQIGKTWWLAVVLIDRWAELFPLCISVFLSQFAGLGLYRWCLEFRLGNPKLRRRIDSMSSYFAAFAFCQFALIIGASILAFSWLHEPSSLFHPRLALATCGIALLAAAQYAITTFSFVFNAGPRQPRGIVMLLLYPPIALALTFTIFAATHWFVGFVVVMARSMSD